MLLKTSGFLNLVGFKKITQAAGTFSLTAEYPSTVANRLVTWELLFIRQRDNAIVVQLQLLSPASEMLHRIMQCL
jgi:hypothetical protein